MTTQSALSHPVPPYGVSIQQAIASGDLAQMKAAADNAAKYLAEHGDIQTSLEALKIEIAKLERASK